MKQSGEYKGPLAGLKVIDFGHYYAGPAAAMLMADQGANVIRIVRPGERELPEQQYRLFNRNKKLLTLDLKTEEGKAQALSLIADADMVIENFRPGVMQRLGLDYPGIKDTNPGLVYLSLPGFASTDKERSHIQAWEGVIAAAAMVYTEGSTYRQRLHYPPVYTSIPQCSMFGGMHGCTAILAALIARHKHGLGTVIEIPLAEIGLTGHLFMQPMYYPLFKPELFSVPPENAPLPYFAYSANDSREVQAEKQRLARDVSVPSPFGSSFYRCGDGRQVVINNECLSKFVEYFAKTLGIWETLQQHGFVNEGCHVFSNNNLGNGAFLTPERKSFVKNLIAEAFLKKPAEEWEQLLSKKSMISVVRTRDEWLSLTPMLDTGVLTQMDNGKSLLTVPGRMADVTGPDGKLMPVSLREPQPIGIKQARQLFGQLAGCQPAKRHSPLIKSDLLQGLRVLDFSNAIAGPNSCYTLAQYGAEVIKVDPPDIDTFHIPALVELFTEVSQGKRSILNNPKTSQGREVMRRLIVSADVVVHNSLDDVTERLGISHDQLQAINPNIVSCQISGYGGTYRGGWENRTSTDPTAQTATGMVVQFGSLEVPHLYGGLAPTDMMCGHTAAMATLLAVYQQRKTGYAAEARTSLARGNNYVQLPFMISEKGRSCWGDASGQFALGESAGYRLYACMDGWIFAAARDDQVQYLAETVCELEGVDEAALVSAFARKTCDQWLKLLTDAGIACHRVLSKMDYAQRCQRFVGNASADDTVEDVTMAFCRDNHPSGRPILSINPSWVRVGENNSYLRLAIGPRPGEHSVEILQELGYDGKEIEALIRLGVVHEFLPALGNKQAYFFNTEPVNDKQRVAMKTVREKAV